MSDIILKAINEVRENLGLVAMERIGDEARLRTDLGMDSLALAEFAVRVEEASGVDVFEKRLVETVGEVREQLQAGGNR